MILADMRDDFACLDALWLLQDHDCIKRFRIDYRVQFPFEDVAPLRLGGYRLTHFGRQNRARFNGLDLDPVRMRRIAFACNDFGPGR
ncbi:hypothetical protein WL99_10505 [Burkholderia cepacia]|nr:hypothetical protein WL99_10505 [Burkholderia cepacia]